MTTYGVTPTGFVIKPLAAILDEVEQQLVTEFGPGVVQTPQSPLGQINGLFADLVAQLWEVAEDVYQSYDPDQAEGVRLDTLGRLRLVARASDEADATYRRSVTNEGAARITLADLVRAVQNVNDVTFCQVFVNEKPHDDDNQMPPNTIAVAVLGGVDEIVAEAANRFIPPGISTHGNQPVPINEDGYCRVIRLVRPAEVETKIHVVLKMSPQRLGCPAPSPSAVGNALLEFLTSAETRPWNGQDITPYLLRSFIESEYSGVEFVSLEGSKAEFPEAYSGGIPFSFYEIAVVTEISVEVIRDDLL